MITCVFTELFTSYIIPIDSETRRRAATDFVRGLMVLYVEQITQIIKNYVEQYLNVRRRKNAHLVLSFSLYLLMLASFYRRTIKIRQSIGKKRIQQYIY